MAIFNLEFSNSRSRKESVKADEHHDYVSRNGKYSPEIIASIDIENQSALSHMEYVKRENAFSRKIEYEDLLYSEDRNMPEWAKENPNIFWKSSEIYERTNGRTYTEIRFALPHELSDEVNKKLVDKFCEDTFGESFVYSYGIHSKPSSEEDIQNIHVHIMFCERKLDGIKREAKQFFKRYNTKFPERGGAKKDRYWHSLKAIPITRASWERMLNEKLEEFGLEKVSAKSLEFQKIEAKIAGDTLKEELLNRHPVNCSGKILMKLEKYGMETLTTAEKEEYDLFILAKKLKKIHEQEYKLALKEKNSELSEDLVQKVILDRSKYHFYNIKNNDNFYELLNDTVKQSFLGLGILNEENKDYSSKINMHIILENTLAKNEIITKGDIKYINPNLKYENILFKDKDYIILEKIIKDLEIKIKDIEVQKERSVSEFRKEFNNWQKDYAKEILFRLNEVYAETGFYDAFFNEQLKRSKEIDKLENEINALSKKIKNDKYITKILDKNILTIKLNKIENLKSNLFFTIRNFTKEKNLNTVYTKYLAEAIVKENKNTLEYREKEKIFKEFYKEYSKLDETLKIQKIALQYSKDERNKCYSEYQKNIKSLNNSSERKHFNFENIKVSINEVKKNNIYNLEKLLIEYQNIYSTVKKILKNKEKYENIINDQEKLKYIAIKSGNSIVNIKDGYNRSIKNFLKEYDKQKYSITLVLKDIRTILKDMATSESDNIYQKFQVENKKLEKKLFTNLDKARNQNDRAEISKIFSELFEVQNRIKALNILFKKEDVLNYSERVKELEEEFLNSEKTEKSKNALDKGNRKEEKIFETNQENNNLTRKISKNKNIKEKSSMKGFYLESSKKRKTKSIVEIEEDEMEI